LRIPSFARLDRHARLGYCFLLLSLSLAVVMLVRPMAWMSVAVTPSPVAPNATVPEQALNQLYDTVWQRVQDKFLDGHTNGQAWHIWRHRYDGKLHTMEDTKVAIDSMLASLGDVYTRYLDVEAFTEETQSIQATLSGIGIQMGMKSDKIVVIAPIEDTPADRAGLKSNDIITAIDGKSTRGMSIEDASKRIKGKKGTPVTLTVERKAPEGATPSPKATMLTFTVVRDDIKLKAVSIKHPLDLTVPEDVGYIRLNAFISQESAREVAEAIAKLKTRKGFILDLRSNPGGLVTNALRIADDLLEEGVIVSTVDRDGYKVTQRANKGTLTDKPVILLIDGGSASASEILSGALKDNHRALLVGQKSFGKGLVQEITPLPLGAGMNITTQKYLTPNNVDINLQGIQPDVEVKPAIAQVVPDKKAGGKKMTSLKEERPKDDPVFQRAVELLRVLSEGKETIRSLKAKSE
jgi:carboxyl-terminal processing protease